MLHHCSLLTAMPALLSASLETAQTRQQGACWKFVALHVHGPSAVKECWRFMALGCDPEAPVALIFFWDDNFDFSI